MANVLLNLGCLWNTFVMVGRVRTFLGMIQRATPVHLIIVNMLCMFHFIAKLMQSCGLALSIELTQGSGGVL